MSNGEPPWATAPPAPDPIIVSRCCPTCDALGANLREATMLLFDWDVTTFGRTGSVVDETKAFLAKVGYRPDHTDRCDYWDGLRCNCGVEG